MRTFFMLSAVLLWAGCAHQPATEASPQVDRVPDWWLTPTRGEDIKYPEHAWEAGVEGDVNLDLCLDRGKVLRAENISGQPELTATVLKAVEGWQFIPSGLQRLHRLFRFKKSPTLADFQEKGTFVITRDYEPPSISDRELGRVLGGISTRSVGEPSWTAGFQLCVAATGVLDSAELAFASNRAVAKALLEGFQKAQFQPAKLRGAAIISCMLSGGSAVRRRGPTVYRP